MKTHSVRTGCEIAGRWRDAGEEITLTEDQARELAPPFGNVVMPISKKEENHDGKLNRNKRRNGRSAE
jgi:hypothetical protein